MFLPVCLLLEYWIDYVTIGQLHVNLYSHLLYPTKEFQALQLIVHVVYGNVYYPYASWMLVQILKIES